jgi:hypothetical protein
MPTITVQLTDTQDGSSSKEFHLAASVTTVAGAQAALDDLVAAWPGVSNAGMSNATVSFPLSMTPIAAVAGPTLDNAARVRLQMETGVGNENYRIPAPAMTTPPDYDYIVGGAVDNEDTALVAFFDLFATGDVFRIGVNSLRAVASIISGYIEKK